MTTREAGLPSVVVLGAGAVGGYFGGRMVQHGTANVTFLVRPERKARLLRDSLRIESPFGNAVLSVDARTRDELAGAAPDYLIVTSKSYDLDSAIADIVPVVGPNTTVVPLLNGLSHLDRLNDAFGSERVIGGTVSLQVRLGADGTVQHLNDWQIITIGEQGGGLSPRVERLADALSRAKLQATASPAILARMWEKLVMLATLAGMTTLMRASVGEIASAPGGAALSLAMLEAHAETAARNGYPVDERQMTVFRRMFADQSHGLTASMLGDMQRGGPIEADHILGFMLDRARAAGLDAPLTAAACANARIYEARRG